MPRFCAHCGALLKEGAKFCAAYGASSQLLVSTSPLGAASGGSPATTTIAPASNVAEPRSAVVKIVLVALSLFALLAALGIGSSIYIGYRVKQKIGELKQQSRSDGATERGSAAQAGSASSQRDSCSLVTKEEIGDALGSPILNVVNRGGLCQYTAADVKTPNGSATFDNSVEIGVEWGDAATKMKGVIGGTKLALGYIGGREAANEVLQPFSGIGDESYYAAGLLQFRKNDADVTIDLSHAHVQDRRTVAKAIAQKVLAKL